MTDSHTPTTVTVETFTFGHLDPDTAHVLIHVDVGKLSPQRIKKYIEDVRVNFNMCVQLDRLGIEYSIVACRGGEKTAIVTTQERTPPQAAKRSTLEDYEPATNVDAEQTAIKVVEACLALGEEEYERDEKTTRFREALVFMQKHCVSLSTERWTRIMADVTLAKVAMHFADESFGKYATDGLDDVMKEGWKQRNHIGVGPDTIPYRDPDVNVAYNLEDSFEDAKRVLDKE